MTQIFLPAKGNQYGAIANFAPGNLISFRYLSFKHDPLPLVLIAKIHGPGKISGINLHYLTFPYVRWIINNYCGKSSFSYQTIKQDKYIVNSYRTYKHSGLTQVRGIDCEFLKTVLTSLRSFDPDEIEAMRKEVNKQLRERMNAKADQLTNKYTNMVYPQNEYNNKKDTQSPHEEPQGIVGPTPTTPASVPPTTQGTI